MDPSGTTITVDSIDHKGTQALGLLRALFDRSDSCRRRSLPAPIDELLDGVVWPFGHDLHAPVRQVAGPTGDPEEPRLLGARASVPDPLHFAAHPEMAPHHAAQCRRLA